MATYNNKKKQKESSYFSFAAAISLFIAVILLIGLAVFAVLTFSTSLEYPESSHIVSEKSFSEYVGLVNITVQFLTTVVGILLTTLFLTVVLLGIQFFLWNKDRHRLTEWRHRGLLIERLELLKGNRVKINSIEIELNRAQYSTLTSLVEQCAKGEPLHPSELPGDNGTQMIKRLREELGGRLVEQTLIKNRRGKGYWIDVDSGLMKNKEDSTK